MSTPRTPHPCGIPRPGGNTSAGYSRVSVNTSRHRYPAIAPRAPRQRTQRGSPRKNAPEICLMRPGAVLRFPASAPRGMGLGSSCHAASNARAPRQRTRRGSPRKNAPGICRMRPRSGTPLPTSAPRGMDLRSSCRAPSKARAPQAPARNKNSKIDSIIKPCPAQQQIYAFPRLGRSLVSRVFLYPSLIPVQSSIPARTNREYTAYLPQTYRETSLTVKKADRFSPVSPVRPQLGHSPAVALPALLGPRILGRSRIKRNIPDKRYSPVGDFPVRMIRFLRSLPLMIRKRDHRSTACVLEGTATNGILSATASPSIKSISSF